MEIKENKRRDFIKTTASAGLLGVFVSFNPLRIFSKDKKKQSLKVIIHPNAVRRTIKGHKNG